MEYDRAYIGDHVRRYVKPYRAELEAPLLNAFDALATSRKLPMPTLAKLASGVSDEKASVYETCAEFLGEVAEGDARALNLIIELSQSNRASIRHNALLCLTAKHDPNVVGVVIGRALRDKSARVRRKAADWTQRLGLRTMEGDLVEALSDEKDAGAANAMKAALLSFKGRE